MDSATWTVYQTTKGDYGWRYTAAVGMVRSMQSGGFATAEDAEAAFNAFWRAREPLLKSLA